MQSDHVTISRLESQFDKVDEILSSYMLDAGIAGKNENRFRLLTEEALRQVKSFIGEKDSIEIWFEGNNRVSNIVLVAKSFMVKERKDEIISLSSTGQNAAEKGIIGALKNLFSPDGASDWSMTEYKAALMKQREEDPYSLEAWNDLERSLLVKLADDISVGVKGEDVKVVITKDFSGSLMLDEELPDATSSVVSVRCKDGEISESIDEAEEIIKDLDLLKKDALHMVLLYEEATGMLKQIAGDFTALMWFEKYPRKCCLKLVIKTDMNMDKKTDLLAMSSTGKNAMTKGIMSKISDVIETGLLSYDDTIRSGMNVGLDFSNMGMYSDANSIGYMWSLEDYRESLKSIIERDEETKEAWDELEKSIVGNLASDVVVGVKRNVVKITVICDISMKA
ncbi:MAG: hypothetical protein K6A69_06475 [Lachnospiraceae bacterium]|nr:hypothetical protein [Lachnospiraceae bacterium]